MHNSNNQIVRIGARCFKRRSLLMGLFGLLVAFSPVKKVSKPVIVCGLSLFTLGLALRFWSTGYADIATRTTKDVAPPQLITNGPFRFSRNPIYTGNQLMFAGALVALGHGLKSLFFCAPVFLFYSLIVRYEESLLSGSFGKSYESYKKRTGRWFGQNLPARQECQQDNCGGSFSLIKALKTERFTLFNCLAMFFLRAAITSARLRLRL